MVRIAAVVARMLIALVQVAQSFVSLIDGYDGRRSGGRT